METLYAVEDTSRQVSHSANPGAFSNYFAVQLEGENFGKSRSEHNEKYTLFKPIALIDYKMQGDRNIEL